MTDNQKKNQQKQAQKNPQPPKPKVQLPPEGFQLVNGNGFRITFPNGHRVVVCFGSSHHCGNFVSEARDPASVHQKDSFAAAFGCSTGAVYTYNVRGEAVKLEGLDEHSWCHKFQTPIQYLEILNKIAALPAPV